MTADNTAAKELLQNLTPYLLVENLSHSFDRFSPSHMVLENINFRIYPRQFTGLVGESGSGKSTMARLISGQLRPTKGKIYLNGREISGMSRRQRRKAKLGMQMVFQNPYSSLHPLQTIGRQLEEPLLIHRPDLGREERWRLVIEMLERVGLDPEIAERYPRALSGGQRQRAAIGCALITRPELLIADEAVSALDLSVQAQILNLFSELRQHLNFACLFISHDMDVVRYLCDRVAVLHEGRICEENKTERIFQNPQDPYTAKLLDISMRNQRAMKKEL